MKSFAAAGDVLYALVDWAGRRDVFCLTAGAWQRLPWDPSQGVPELLSTDGGSLTVLTSEVISEIGVPPIRLYEHAIRAFDGEQWNEIAAMELQLGFSDEREFTDMTLFNGSWYVASRHLNNEALTRHGEGVLYRSSNGTLARFASTQYETCFLDFETCSTFPTLNTLQAVGNSLYIGGFMEFFTFAGSSSFIPVKSVVRIIGDAVVVMPTSPSGVVRGMYLENSASSNPGLVAWGDFGPFGTINASRIARWDTVSSTWSVFGSGLAQTPVAALQIAGDTENDIDCVVVGVTQAGGVNVNGLARWTGSAWQNFGGTGVSVLQGVYRSAIHFGGVTVGGTNLSVSDGSRPGAARWTGTTWSSLASPALGTDGRGRVVARHNNQTYVGGDFTVIDSVSANRIAQRNSQTGTWQPLGSGMNGPVRALISFNGELIAGGSFTAAGGVSASNVAAWNGVSWNSLGAGLNGTVNGFTTWNGSLIAVGAFQFSGSTPVSNVARWTGTLWVPVDPSFATSEVFCAAVYQGTLYVGGVGDMWRVQGGTISTVGRIGNGQVRALLAYAGSLYVGGTFTRVGSPFQFYSRIARFNGTQWFSMASAFSGNFNSGSVESISANADTILVTGDFDVATSGGTATNIALFDGAWSPLPGGAADEIVRSGTFVGSRIAVAGDFEIVGAVQSPSYAEWSDEPNVIENPADAEICLDVADSVVFEVRISAGTTTPQYRWRRNGTNLSDDLRTSGTTTPTLAIDSLTLDDSGVFDCVITTCNSITSSPATLTVRDSGDPVCLGCPSCPADFDQDGGVTGADIAAFFAEYEQGAPCADADQDGGVTGGDIAAFFVAYEAGGC